MSQQTGRITAIALFVLFSTMAFALFAYNSGYGYDQLEYLVIGRALAEGIPFYTYIPSKGPGIYYLIALLNKAGVPFGHASLSIVIAGIYALVVAATYAVARRWFSAGVALGAAVLTGACAAFMELNFLEPTPFVYLAGLGAFDATLRYKSHGALKYLFLAGLALGAGLAFKATAAFYGLAIAFYLGFDCLRGRSTIGKLVTQGAVIAGGTLLIPAALWLYFLQLGKAHAYLQWTFTFPLLHYPSNLIYVYKAYTKLLWVHLLIGGALILSVSARRRDLLRRRPEVAAALVFGGCAYLSLLKTQASHYFFAGAPFLVLYSLSIYEDAFAQHAPASRGFPRMAIAAAAVVAVAAVVSILTYQPAVTRRLVGLRDYSPRERLLANFVQHRVDPDHYVLFAGGAYASTWGYWVSHRYPPPPFINADVKTIWALRNQPEEVYAVLSDPRLMLVQFEPDERTRPRMEDVFGDEPGDAPRMREYFHRLVTDFRRIDGGVLGATYWSRS